VKTVWEERPPKKAPVSFEEVLFRDIGADPEKKDRRFSDGLSP